MFLGTPHNGSSAMETQSRLLQSIAAAQWEIEDGALMTLREGNETLVEVVRTFTKHMTVRMPKPRIICIYEEKRTELQRTIGEDGGPKVWTITQQHQPISFAFAKVQHY